jgi:hypothetical protein
LYTEPYGAYVRKYTYPQPTLGVPSGSQIGPEYAKISPNHPKSGHIGQIDLYCPLFNQDWVSVRQFTTGYCYILTFYFKVIETGIT